MEVTVGELQVSNDEDDDEEEDIVDNWILWIARFD